MAEGYEVMAPAAFFKPAEERDAISARWDAEAREAQWLEMEEIEFYRDALRWRGFDEVPVTKEIAQDVQVLQRDGEISGDYFIYNGLFNTLPEGGYEGLEESPLSMSGSGNAGWRPMPGDLIGAYNEIKKAKNAK